MTRSVPGGQRASSKDPAETSALWGITAQHFIISSLSHSTELNSGHTKAHEREGGRDRKSKGKESGVYLGATVTKGVEILTGLNYAFKQKREKGITQQRSHPHL